MDNAVDAGLRTPEVARRLGISGAEVYGLIFNGDLAGRPDDEGVVRVTRASVEEYLQRRGRTVASTGG